MKWVVAGEDDFFKTDNGKREAKGQGMKMDSIRIA